MLKKIFFTFALLAGAACAQQWEVGVLGGYGYFPDLSLTGPAGSANTGFKSGPIVGVYGGGDTYSHWSAEARYLYQWSDLKLSSGSTSVDFAGHTHILHADFLGHLQPREARIRLFGAVGAGIKIAVGTGLESSAQPLGNFAALTNTREVLPIGDAGFGVKIRFRQHGQLRFEMRDYVSPSPNKVIAPAPGVRIGGVLNDIQGLASIGYLW